MTARPVRIDIGICTFRRQELRATLLSLAMIDVPEGVSLRIIVADNDQSPSAAALVDGLRQSLPWGICYVHCPAGNISIARNACLDASDADYLAFIDDDETASQTWLTALFKVARDSGADAVLGPVQAVYGASAPGWMSKGDFHSTFPVFVGGDIRTGYTCNVLLDLKSPRLEGRRFNLALGKTGGEDTEFFTHIHRQGGKIAYAGEAWVNEPVTEGRASFNWLAKRRYRMGQTHGRLLMEKSGALGRVKQVPLAAAKAAFCFAAALLTVFLPVRRNRFILRGLLHVGAISGLLGFREIHQYGTLEAAQP
ncbi:glycosyltransferase [Rhizobium paknamense]|uniref:Succinoglycan biosynthesis protein ExoM n=1 Tax=Rhizobium paknamense TaxID=1206817 RepID=A0ABU0ILX5_9HYPH|nr:glycosyltransferase family 2 protein [Rhizobium paknamense]MDQ0458375.1 succinoglycan biosynthesis protein ExoM [Rhizobium paknamense]